MSSGASRLIVKAVGNGFGSGSPASAQTGLPVRWSLDIPERAISALRAAREWHEAAQRLPVIGIRMVRDCLNGIRATLAVSP